MLNMLFIQASQRVSEAGGRVQQEDELRSDSRRQGIHPRNVYAVESSNSQR